MFNFIKKNLIFSMEKFGVVLYSGFYGMYCHEVFCLLHPQTNAENVATYHGQNACPA